MLQLASSKRLRYTPDSAIAVVGVGILRGEMRRHQRGIRPVEQARGQAVMLRHGQKLPESRILGKVCIAVFAKAADDRLLKA